MPEISIFKITRAKAEITLRGLRVTLTYPEKPDPIEKRFPENLDFGEKVFTNLINKGYADIASFSNPLPPPSSGAIYLLKDNSIICSRRDRFAPTHKLWHEAYAGFPEEFKDVFTKSGLDKIGLRECTEECILLTNEPVPRLIVPNEAIAETRNSAAELGLNLNELHCNVEIIRGNDELIVIDESGKLIFKMDAFINFSFESGTVFNVLKIIKIPFSSHEVVPIDGEFIVKNNQKIRLNREAYILPLKDLHKINFGSPLNNFKVYQSDIIEGKPLVKIPKYSPPYFGPNVSSAENPHIWAPDNNLVRLLEGLGVRCRINSQNLDWMHHELIKYTLKKSGKLFAN